MLRIGDCRVTKFPDWLGHSTYHSMTKLNLQRCGNCCRLPSLGQLPSLKTLSIYGFGALEVIGDEFYQSDESCCQTPFPSLETLPFAVMPSWREWRSFNSDAFPRVKGLSMNSCPMIRGDFPIHLPALENLDITLCEQLACSLPKTPAIVTIPTSQCDELGMQELPLSLRTLSIGGRRLVEFALEAMIHTQKTCLRYLSISNRDSAMSFPAGDWVPASLEELVIRHCKNLEFPMQQQQYEQLQSTVIEDSCDSLTSFHLESFPNLTSLEIKRCANIKSLVMSETHPLTLRSLSVSGCPHFVSFSTLGTNAPELEFLEIRDCPEIDSIAERVLPSNLRRLCIRECDKLVRCITMMDLHGYSLTHLAIEGPCESVKSPSHQWRVGCLPHLSLCRCGAFKVWRRWTAGDFSTSPPSNDW